MVFLTIVPNKNGETVYFEDPIPKVNFMKLISSSLLTSHKKRINQCATPFFVETNT